MQRHEEASITVPGVLLDQDLLVAKISHAGAAVFLVCPHEQQASLPGLAKGLAIDDALLVPALTVGTDLVLHETPHRVTEHVVFFIK